MADVILARAASDPDRLPWFPDERAPVTASGSQQMLWSPLALILASGASYWLAARSAASDRAPQADAPEAPAAAPRVATPTPAPLAVAAAPPPAASDFAPETRPLIKVDAPEPAQQQPAPASLAKPQPAVRTPQAAPRQPAAPVPSALQAWPANRSRGASGRMVRIGTFASRPQAKRAWSRLVDVYPGLRRLEAVVAPVPSLRNGQTYYRLQFGTTSQAHSAVLCQRMRIVGQSCVVVGLGGQAGAIG